MIKRASLLLTILASLTTYWFIPDSIPNFASASMPNVRYVAPTGIDTGDCTSPVSPCRTLQYAVDKAVSGDTILVATGVYTYQSAVDSCPTGDTFLQTRAVVCFIDKRLAILGGYSASNWSQSNPSENPTIIDGQNQYRGVAAIGYRTTDTHLEMRGITIQNGRAEGPTYRNPYDPSGVGGGMLIQHASVTLKDVVFKNNRAVGQSTSSGAGGQADGAALRIEEPPAGTVSLLQRVVFEGNQSLGGAGPQRGGVAFGALFIYKASVVIEDSMLTNNLAQAGNSSGNGSFGNPPNADALGGGIAVEEGNVVLRRVTVTGNQVKGGNALKFGGGAYGGGIFVEDFANNVTSVTIVDSYIANNLATGGDASAGSSDSMGGRAVGGGVCTANSTVQIERTWVISNTAIGGNASGAGKAGNGAGGGMYIFVQQSGPFSASLTNTVVADNAAYQGNGVTNLGNGGGGGIVIHGENAYLNHITLARNRIGANLVLGQGLLVQPWPSPDDPSLQPTVYFKYGIVANHTQGGQNAAAIVVQKNSSLVFEHGIFAGNNRDTNADSIPVVPGTITGLSTMEGVSSVGFVAPGSPYYNYHIRIDSAAKNRRTSPIGDDIDQQSRPYDDLSDDGADEYHPFSLTVVPRDGELYLNWTQGAEAFKGGIDRYELLVTCEEGANPPAQVGCGQPLNLGTTSAFTLTGLTNFKKYTIEVKAYDSNGQLIATSVVVNAFPTTIFVFLPMVLK